MQKKSWPFIFLLLNNIAFAADDIDPIVKTFIHKSYLKIPDGREVVISQPGRKPDDITMKRVFLRKKETILWDKIFGTGRDNLIWWDAHFMPVVSGKFIYDIDNDGIEEIAIATWHGGNDITSCTAYVFSLKEDTLVLKEKKRINYEFSRSVY
jgi:hypothetical protein